MRSCREASELTAVEGQRRLSLSEKVSLAIHRVICAPCRAYKKQIEYFDDAMSKISDQDAAPKFTMDDEAKRRISEKMKQSQDGTD